MRINQTLKTNFYKPNNYEKKYSLYNQNDKDTVSFKGDLVKSYTKHSVRTSVVPYGRQYKIISMPKGMDISGCEKTENHIPTVAVFDMFGKDSQVKVGQNTKVSHGDLVTKYITSGLEDKIGVLVYDVTPQSNKSVHENLADALEDLAEIQKKQKSITALNLSLGECFTFERINDELGTDVDIHNIEQEKNNLLTALQKSKNARLKNSYRAIQAINSLVENGTQVYCSSGNIGKNGINILTLSNAQHIVSAKDYSNASQLFVTDFYDAQHSFQKIYNEDNQLVKITDDKITLDIDEIQVKSPIKTFWENLTSKSTYTIQGTSFSSANLLNANLKKTLT